MVKKSKKKSMKVPASDLDVYPSNADLKQLITKVVSRFENWRVEAEQNPNPRLVHSLKNILALIDSVTTITESKIRSSYKQLARQMSLLLTSVADLNTTISDAIMDDDFVDDQEEKRINDALMYMVRTAMDLIVLVQQSFGSRNKMLPKR